MNLDGLFSLEGRIALITGGTSGIGRMMAEGFLAQGAKVYICSRKRDQCEAVSAELGENCVAIPEDLSTISGCENLVRNYALMENHLDILVNNAGAAWAEDFSLFSERGWDRVMNLNLKSPFFLTQKFHQMLKATAKPDRPNKVINIGSVDGQRLTPWETYSYHSSKAALHYLTKRLAARLIEDHINVSAIAPGAFRSNMNHVARDRGEELSSLIPAGRIGEPEDIAAAAIYLASRAGDYVVGDTITVDGGAVNATMGKPIAL